MKKRNLITLCGLAVLSSSAFASSNPSGLYALGAVGETGMGDSGYWDDYTDSSGHMSSIDHVEFEGKGATQLYSLGYQINRVVGVEATYMNYGNIDAKVNHKDSYSVYDPESFSVSANLGYSFHNGLRPFAKVGLSYVDLGTTDDIISPIKGSDKRGGIHIGAGVEYALDLGENHGNVLFRTGVEGDVVNIDINEKTEHGAVEGDYDWALVTVYAGVGYRF
ncbi:hypothetical protein A9264_13550 [Vibrio sp. UCD-FRSSP16_10]|uniref:outer membrane protein n=1 Tax=unclassified Vibrio TaxID=2614977 RepID=UPI0008022A0A|nr:MULTISPECIES: outer membrane beta-barrel protein [unclassified Vibrio]OBT14796.1 hypothetical protein A9260_13765 [Vibrio sp. UCD-FRSSP16_30]OBT20085.1 hypothetical protein A9264_13550 [Vibrio sp. UCD-FRSSP16_10]